MAKKKATTKSTGAKVKGTRRKKPAGGGTQLHIAGTEPPSFPDLDRLITNYVNTRDERMGLTEQEVKWQAEVIAGMKKYDLTEYKFDGVTAKLESQPADIKLKVKRAKVKNDDVSEVTVTDPDDDNGELADL